MGRMQPAFVIGVCLVAMLVLADASWAEKRLQLIGRYYGPRPSLLFSGDSGEGSQSLYPAGTYVESFGTHCLYPFEPRGQRCMPPKDLTLLLPRQTEEPIGDCVDLFRVGPDRLSVARSSQCLKLLSSKDRD